MRTSNGCWTCKLRKKKCDERQPVCDMCAALLITCHYDQEKPEWMDGSVRQEEMAERLKREVKEKAHHRRGERANHTISSDDPDIHNGGTPGVEPCPEASTIMLQRRADCTLTADLSRENIIFGRSDTVLLTFYLEHVLPFLFPFYRPSLLEGGKAWILEMMISSPVVRQATLCQSSYFFSLACGAGERDVPWDTVLTQTRDAFGVLRQSLQVITNSEITQHLHGAVRIMASIMQVQRFEIAVLSFNNCHSHLNAALALFIQLLESSSSAGIEPNVSSINFVVVMSRLGPPTMVLPSQSVQVPSAEQAAFRFSSALLILDDIIASTILQRHPRLYGYHNSLLGTNDGAGPPVNLEAVIGCQNWVLLQIGEIAMLDAWKQQCRMSGDLNVMELVHRAKTIKSFLEAHLRRLKDQPTDILSNLSNNPLNYIFTPDYRPTSSRPADQTCLVTCVWAHAALIYLHVVVSGWQTATVDVRYHVSQIVELLAHQISPPALLRTMVWPFCVAGCVAESSQEAYFRGVVEALQPPNVFGTVHKAFDIMENVWRCTRDASNVTDYDFATCFRSQGDLVLLV